MLEAGEGFRGHLIDNGFGNTFIILLINPLVLLCIPLYYKKQPM